MFGMTCHKKKKLMANLIYPFDPSLINYGFGNAPGYGGFHNGVDFAVGQGTPLIATAAGVIRNNDAGAVDGAGVDITTDDGWKVRMWHVSKFLVPNGSRVNAGDTVALSGGARGTWGAGNATGPHLHWGVAVDGRDNWVDPIGLNPKMFDENKPIKPENNSEEVGEMFVMRNVNTGNVYTVGKQFIRHEVTMSGAEYVARVVSADKAIIQCTTAELNAVLDSFAIPRDKVQSTIGGKFWSREQDILNAINGKK